MEINRLAKRIIPCLDIKDGRTVKGINFMDLVDAGDPVELAERYSLEGADELVFLDITATEEARETVAALVAEVSAVISIPFTVGGGVRSVMDAGRLLDAGADKVAVNSAAVKDPSLVDDLAKHFGQQCVVVAIDARKVNEKSLVHIHGGKIPTERETVSWVSEVVGRGAGEILLTSMDHDGTKNGYAVELTRRVSRLASVPVIASGGAGCIDHFTDIFKDGEADAALAASLFHKKLLSIHDLKEALLKQSILVRT